MNHPTRRSVLGLLGAAPLAIAASGTARAEPFRSPQSDPGDAIQEIIHRPAFENSQWAMAFQTVGAERPVYAIDPSRLCVAASAMKVFIAGAAFDALGPEYRFRTRVYRTGPVVAGVLKGDLVLVASGDMVLGSRIRRDGSLALPEPDHSYDQVPGAGPVPGDPLQIIRDLAAQVATRVRRIEGRVLVDTSLFREVKEVIASGGLAITVSPMMINDNLIDVTVSPGASAGAPAELRVSPQTGYVRFVNEVTTIPASTPARPLRYVNDVTNPDGTHTVTLTGEVPMGGRAFLAYYIPEPGRFASTALALALRDIGVRAETDLLATPDFPALAAHYTPRNRLAEHVSPPLAEQVKVMLKISSNIHTVMWPYVVGSIAGRDRENPKAAYETLIRRLYLEAGVNPDVPGVPQGRFTSEFFVKFLAHMARKPYFRPYRLAMPIMGKDGSLAGVEVGSPAAGHVYAKTGTAVGGFDPSGKVMLFKALAGFIQSPHEQWLTFAEFMEREVPSLPAGMELATQAGEAMGAIATAVYRAQR